MRKLIAVAALAALVGMGAEGAEAMPAVTGVEIDRTASNRVGVESRISLPASRGRHKVLVAVEVFRREDRHGMVQGTVAKFQRWVRAPRRASTTTVRFRLGGRASRHLIRRGIFDRRHGHADRHRHKTARELVTVHVRGHRDADGNGRVELLEVAGADGWHRPVGARASGTGAVLAIRNAAGEPVAISTTPINCMYDRGEERSNLYMLNGTLPPAGSASAYIEGNAGAFSFGVSPISAYSTMVDWLKQYGAQLGVGPAIGALISEAVSKSLGLITVWQKSCAFSPSLFGVVATGKQSGRWALAIYEIGKGFPRNARLVTDWSSSDALKVGDTTGSGASLSIRVGQ